MKVGALKRKIQLLDRLRSGIGCSIDHLALEMAVSRRTVFRDLEELGKAGYRFDVKNSQYRLAPHFGLTPPKLEPQELVAILFAAHVSPLMSHPILGADLRQAMRKLLDKAKPSERNEIVELLAVCEVRSDQGSGASAADPPVGEPKVLTCLLRALGGKRSVRMTFNDGSEQSAAETTFAPKRLTIANDRWTVAGYSSLHHGQHSFTLHQIVQVVVEPIADERGSPANSG